jgi:site-specific DNA recombinase
VYRKIKKTSRKFRPESEWIKIKTFAIIEEELFMRAQRQLKRNFELSNRNKKNEYLLAGKIRCTCGRSRAGEGPQHGKHLYYRCTSRVHSYPLPSTCSERGINARIADNLVWLKVTKLMTSKDLMLKHARRWMNQRQSKQSEPSVDIDAMRKDIFKLKEQESRYMRAYGAGVYTIEALQEYIVPVKERISSLENQIAEAFTNRERASNVGIPTSHEIEAHVQNSARKLQNLNFDGKRVIVMRTVDRIVGTPKELQVYGHIQINNYVEFKTSNRNRRTSQRR